MSTTFCLWSVKKSPPCRASKSPCPRDAPPPPPVAPPAPPPPAPAKPPLRIGYSDWPGWTAFEIGIQKGWFKEAGVDVKFDWFEYAPSMEAFAAGKVDAVMMTMGDALVTGVTMICGAGCAA